MLGCHDLHVFYNIGEENYCISHQKDVGLAFPISSVQVTYGVGWRVLVHCYFLMNIFAFWSMLLLFIWLVNVLKKCYLVFSFFCLKNGVGWRDLVPCYFLMNIFSLLLDAIIVRMYSKYAIWYIRFFFLLEIWYIHLLWQLHAWR